MISIQRPEGKYTVSFDSVGHNYLKKPITRNAYDKQRRMLLALEKTSQALTLAIDVKLILSNIASALGRSLGAKYVNFWDFTADKKGLFIIAAYGMQNQYLEHSRLDPILLGTAWVGRAVATGKPWASTDAQRDPVLPSTWLPAVKKQDYHGIVCAPLIVNDKVLGGMCIYYKDIHKFDHFEMSLVNIVANQAATAVSNARLFSELLTEKNKTIATIQSLKDGLIMYDLEGKVTFFNLKAEELLWLRANDVVGKKFDKKICEQSVYLKNLYNISCIIQMEYASKEFTTEGPQKLILEITHVPIRDQYKKIGTMQILRNITKEKEIEQLKSGFITTASHQLRTPLSGIKWGLDMLAKGDLGKLSREQKDIVLKLSKNNLQLIHLVDDLLDVSRIDEGRFDYKFSKGDLKKLVKKICQELNTDAERKKISFIFESPSTPLPKIYFDPLRLDIAIRNIIDNAIKYTHTNGKIKIYFHLEKDAVLLLIRDNGIGIPESDRQYIFLKFFRARNAVSYQTEGSGLGLYIAKSIIEKHNAFLYFESAESKGSTFIFRFPLQRKND